MLSLAYVPCRQCADDGLRARFDSSKGQVLLLFCGCSRLYGREQYKGKGSGKKSDVGSRDPAAVKNKRKVEGNGNFYKGIGNSDDGNGDSGDGELGAFRDRGLGCGRARDLRRCADPEGVEGRPDEEEQKLTAERG